MNPSDDVRRKFSQIPNFKPVGPTANLTVNKDWKRSDVSRQKQDKKPLERHALKINTLVCDEGGKSNAKNINFKNLKDTAQKKQPLNTVVTQKLHIHNNPATFVKPSLEFNKNMNIRSPPAEGHGISINVNIQNMLQQRQVPRMETQTNPISDRSAIGEQKKLKKVVSTINMTKIDDFQCKQELSYKRTSKQKQNKTTGKTVEKRPLIDRKTNIKAINQSATISARIPYKQDPKQIKEQLKKFQGQIDQINSIAETQKLSYLDHRRQAYLIPPDYINRSQKNFNWKMRSILFQWMMQVSYEFSLKRQTFYKAVNLVDLFLSKDCHVPRTDFQLAGTAAMFIASKLQQFEPKCSDDFAKSTQKYSATEVKEMQKKICKTLRYALNPPTLSTWANRLMLQWDCFLQQDKYCSNHPFFAMNQPKYFKKCDNQSYFRFRTIMQFIDCAILDIHTVQYPPKLLICAFMYLVLGRDFGIFGHKIIWTEFPQSSQYLVDEQNLFNDLFMDFLQTSFNILLIDLLPTVQYCATYFGLPLNFEQPITSGAKNVEDIDFQDFCSYQTYNPSSKAYILKVRNRGDYE